MQLPLLLLIVLTIFAARPTVRFDHKGVSRTRAWNNVLPEALLKRLREECLTLNNYVSTLPALKNGKYSTFWYPNRAPPKTVFEEAISYLQPLAKLGPSNGGSEWWVQVVDGGPTGNIGFHVDKDESVASIQQYLSHPEYSSIFYVESIGGGTLILDQYSPSGMGYHPEVPQEGDLSFPRRNKYVVFNGDLLHGVIPGTDSPESKRITFLVNYWTSKPEPPNCIFIDYAVARTYGVIVFDEPGLLDLRKKIKQKPRKKRTKARLEVLDLRAEQNHSVPTYQYTVSLPGRGHTSVLLPTTHKRGSTVLIRWKKNRDGSTSPRESGWVKEEIKGEQEKGKEKENIKLKQKEQEKKGVETNVNSNADREQRLAEYGRIKKQLLETLHLKGDL